MSRNQLTRMTGKKINNPFIKKNKNKKFRKKCFICLIFGFVLIALFVYFVFFTSFFKIKNIKISDLNKVNENEIENIVQAQIDSRNSFFSQENILFFNEKELLKQLSDYNFLEVDIKKSLISGLKITILEREVRYILEEGDYFYYLDDLANIVKNKRVCFNSSEGSQITLASSTEEELLALEEKALDDCLKLKNEALKDNYYPVIENIHSNSKIDLDNKKAKISKEYLDFANKIFNDFGIESDFRVKKFIIDEAKDTLKVKLYNDIIVFFSLKDDQESQIKRFLLLKNEYRDKLKGVEYVDIRYGDKIYYR
ncbi:MAG: hypothetical protein WCY43_00530 [Patescibacteria group bacterium]|nr:hypothetical protein [Patescibacteria group bacterium]